MLSKVFVNIKAVLQNHSSQCCYWLNFFCWAYNPRALDHPILGPKFGPIPNAKKYGFFRIPDKKFPIWQKIFFFFLVLYLYFIEYKTLASSSPFSHSTLR